MGMQREHWLWIAGITLAGLVLRCLAARGGLWLDEAWSAIFAQEVTTPAGVLFQINHDNNHHLNTLWLQLVGPAAPPMLQRALSIVSGTSTIVIAARIAARRGPAPAVVAAVAFCVAPFLLTYGAEARGYAPMLLAWVWAIDVADRWLADPAHPRPTTALAIAALLGCLAQATMLFGLFLLGLWVVLERCWDAGWRQGLRDTVVLLAPAAAVSLLLIATAWFAASAGGTGFHLGNREPHDWGKWFDAMGQLIGGTIGPAVVLVLLAYLARDVCDRLKTLAAIAWAFPLLVALLALPNSGAARYYIVIVPPLLLFAAITLPAAWHRHRSVDRWLAGGIVLAFLVQAGFADSVMVRNLRGDPGRAIATLSRVAPRGATVSVDYDRSSAILIAAAWSQQYPLTLAASPCPPAHFHFVERDGDAAFPGSPGWYGRAYREIARGDPAGLSGTHWRLYAAMR
ncbi:hypothetical protein ASE57_08885 [Sphingomonas sp. Leaf11]|nr:hypothetical protein ASE58_08890 [Sphingomonas sp. Leaf9]KQM43424.1 hypothetical protein ASE57_08885 [Sphingomonas sp. Leaf11]